MSDQEPVRITLVLTMREYEMVRAAVASFGAITAKGMSERELDALFRTIRAQAQEQTNGK